MDDKLTREQLIELVERIRDPNSDDDEISAWLVLFSRNVPHPAVSNLIFWSHLYGLGDNPRAEEVVDAALSYEPIRL